MQIKVVLPIELLLEAFKKTDLIQNCVLLKKILNLISLEGL